MKFRIKESVSVREIEDKIVFYDTKRALFYGLRGALVPYLIQKEELEIPRMIEYLLKEYEVDELTATKDTEDVINNLIENGIIEMIDV